MDRQELNTLINAGPVRLTMNDGRSFDIPGPEMATASDILLRFSFEPKMANYAMPICR